MGQRVSEDLTPFHVPVTSYERERSEFTVICRSGARKPYGIDGGDLQAGRIVFAGPKSIYPTYINRYYFTIFKLPRRLPPQKNGFTNNNLI